MPYPDQDLFGTQEEALNKAKVLGCYIDDTSFHQHEDGDEVFYMPCKTHQEYEDLTEMRSEQRSEHINVPDYVQANAQRGLDNLDRAGDGLVERTISEARSLARGSITEDKLRRLSAGLKDIEVIFNLIKSKMVRSLLVWLHTGFGDLDQQKYLLDLCSMELTEQLTGQIVKLAN